MPLFQFVVHSDLIFLYVQNNRHDKSSCHLSPYKDYIVIDYILHNVFVMPITHLFCIWKFVPLNLPHLFFSSSNFNPLQQPSACSRDLQLIFVLLHLFTCFNFQIPHIIKIVQNLKKKKKRICLNSGDSGFNLWVGKIPWRRKWQPTLVVWSGESHGQRSLVGYSYDVAESWTQLWD